MEPIRILHENVIMDPGGIETLLMNVYRMKMKLNQWEEEFSELPSLAHSRVNIKNL